MNYGINNIHSNNNNNNKQFNSNFLPEMTNNNHDHFKNWRSYDNSPYTQTLDLPPSPNCQSFLAPPSLYSRERSFSSSSCESSISQQSGRSLDTPRRHRRNSSRTSDIVIEEKPLTILAFLHGAQVWYFRFMRRVQSGINKLYTRSKPRRPAVVCEGEIVEQVSWICQDYILKKLNQRDLLTRKVSLTPSHWPRSSHVIAAGAALECLYPRTYSNVSRKLCMTMTSSMVVRTTLTSVLEVMFEGNITWGKMVSMFVVAGLFAEECSSQGHSDYVRVVLDTVLDFSSSHLLDWLVAQGGWESFPAPNEETNDRLSKLRLLALLGATTALLASSHRVLDLWTE